MKKNLFVFVILFILCSILLSCKKSDINTGFEIKYTTVEVLNARKTASMDGEITVLLPYGTMVNVKKTDNKSKYNGKDGFWYYSKEIDSYIFSLFLSESKPGGQIQYTINQIDEDGVHYEDCSSESIIKMSNMTAREVYKKDCLHEKFKGEKDGSYKIYPDHIEIIWNDYKDFTTEMASNTTSFRIQKGYTQKFFWSSSAKGWLDEEDFKLTRKGKCKYLTDECKIDFSDLFESENQPDENPSDNEEIKKRITVFPIYCVKKQ